jgi:HK97 gp10 family phage protein
MLTAISTWRPRPGAVADLIARIEGGAEAGVTAVAQRVLDAAQAIVPVRTGDLRDSGHLEVNRTRGQASAAVVFDSDHAVYVEFGTGQRGAASAGAGPGPYSPTWPGMPAQPYLRPAFDEQRTSAESVTRDSINAAL